MDTLLDRIAMIAVEEGISITRLEQRIGASKGVLSRALQNKTDIQAKWLERIVENFPRFNLHWLITGEGEMLRADPSAVKSYSNVGGVPYFAVDFLAGFDLVMNDQTAKPDGYISFPNIRGAQAWVDISGKSMSPLIDPGDVIALKKVEDWPVNILYGEVYALVTEQYRTVKRIRKSDRQGWIRLVPENPDYDAQDIPAASVIAVFQVLGCAKKIF